VVFAFLGEAALAAAAGFSAIVGAIEGRGGLFALAAVILGAAPAGMAAIVASSRRMHRQLATEALDRSRTIEELEAIDSAQIPRERIRGICGNDSKLASYYAGATALVVPSLYEGFGIPVVEAMRCGCPVIASNTSSLPEVGGDAIRCFDPREPEAIAEMMRRVAEDSTLRENMVFQGRAQAARFSWNKCARETYAVYKHALR